MRREIEAVNHHRTVLKAVIDDLELQLRNSEEKQWSIAADGPRLRTEEDIQWEVNRLKRKLSAMSDLCRLYHSGLVTLQTGADSDRTTARKDRVIQKMYEDEIGLLEARLESSQIKLRQYRKYGLEVRKQFEEMLKSVHR